MTNVTEAHKQKACELISAEEGSRGLWTWPRHSEYPAVVACARLIAEQEAPKHPPELVERMGTELRFALPYMTLEQEPRVRAILAELDALHPDPVKECLAEAYGSAPAEYVGAFNHALAKRGMHITEIAK